MANLTTTPDLVQYVEEGMGELNDGTSSFRTKVLQQLNRANRGLHAGGLDLNPEMRKPTLFPWARAQYPKIVNFEAPISAGTVSVTLGSTSITLSSAPASSVAGYYFRVTGDSEVYRISAHTGGAGGATLDGAYVNANNAAASYEIFKLRYDFGTDVLAPISPIRVFASQRWADGMRQIYLIERSEMDAMYPLAFIEKEFPTRAAVVYQTDGSLTLQFNRYPTEAERMEMDYVAVPADLDLVGSNPVLPRQHRVVIAEWALALLLDEVDDERGLAHLEVAKRGFNGMAAEARGMSMVANRNFGRIIARRDEMSASDDILRTTDGFIIG